MGADANLVYTHTGDTVSGLSGAELNTASMTGDATYQLQILGLANEVSGNLLGTNSKLLVKIKIPSYATGVAGV